VAILVAIPSKCSLAMLVAIHLWRCPDAFVSILVTILVTIHVEILIGAFHGNSRGDCPGDCHWR
jgi:hypothetical protein